MLLPEQRDFYTRWRRKADNIVADTIENCIDKYVTLFIIYNSLYSSTAEKTAANNKGRPLGDKESATTLISNFIGPGNILANLVHNNNNPDIAKLIATMDHFNIKLDRTGAPQPKKDQQLKNNLQSPDENIKILALLEVLYSVRCNIVHGHKGLMAYQMMLVEPVINILSTIVTQLYNTLDRHPN